MCGSDGLSLSSSLLICGKSCRCQAENPLNALPSFTRPALIAILATFALAYDDDHAVAVDVLVGQCHGFGYPQSCGIDRSEDRPHLQIGRALQQAHDLVARQDARQCVGLATEGKVLSHVRTPKRRTVKESNAAYDRDDGGGG